MIKRREALFYLMVIMGLLAYCTGCNSTGYSTQEEAMEAAYESNSPLFIYMTAEWCNVCERMKKETLGDREVKSMLRKEYITHYVDVEKPGNEAFKRHYAQGPIPHYFIASMVSRTQFRVVKDGNGYMSPQEFMRWLEIRSN